MDFGVGYFPTHDGMNPGALARLPSGPRSTVERALDRWAGAISEFTGG